MTNKNKQIDTAIKQLLETTELLEQYRSDREQNKSLVEYSDEWRALNNAVGFCFEALDLLTNLKS